MRKNRRTLIIFLCIVAIACLAWIFFIPRIPSYKGHSLNYWLAMIDDKDYDSGLVWRSWTKQERYVGNRAVAADAIRRMGTNTLPFLIAEVTKGEPDNLIKIESFLRKHNLFGTSWISNRIHQEKILRHQSSLALAALGPDAKPALPTLLKAFTATNQHLKELTMPMAAIGSEGWIELTKAITNSSGIMAINGIWGMGIHGAAVPGTVDGLLQILTNSKSMGEAPLSAWALGQIKKEPERVIPALIAGLQSTNIYIRWSSANGLEGFGPQASNAIPALQKTLEDPDRSVRMYATNALKAITSKTEH